MKNKQILLILILAAVLRLWGLGHIPPSPDWDEASLGWNAYSIMKTGKDEYGQFFPLILRSFDDYKPAIYAYLAIPSIKLFGLNTFAVRLPAALLGILAVYLVYLLTKELFPKLQTLPIIVSLLLAISPWHLQFSRVAFETNIGLFVNVLIALCFLKGLKKPKLLLLAAFFAGLNIYVYQAEKLFTPLMVLLLFFVWRKELFAVPKKYLFGSIGVGLVMLLPFFYLAVTTPQIFLRAKGTSFASDQTTFLSKNVERLARDRQNNDLLGLVLDNRRLTYGITFISGYLSHFDLNWLFITGDEARHHAPGMGILYLWELPFLLLGIYSLFFSKANSKIKIFVFAWLLLAPIPASFSSGAPHAVRTIRMLPIPQILVGFGLLSFFPTLKQRQKIIKLAITGLISIFVIFNVAYYLDQYFVQLNKQTSQSWQYGYKQAVEEVAKIEGQYQRIIVSNQPHLDQSYMFFLFYLKYDPASYQHEGGTISGGFNETHRGFYKYTFRPIEWSMEEKDPRILYVGRPSDFSQDAKVIKTINFLDGQPAIKIVEGK